MRHLSTVVAAALVLAVASPARSQSETLLVLKDGRRFTVTRIERRGDRVRFQVSGGGVFEIGVDQVAEPPVDSIPEAGSAPQAPPPAASGGAAAAPAAQGEQTLVLADGRRIQVVRIERQGDRVRFRTTRGEDFEVPAAQVVSPPVESIPLAGQAPAGPPQIEVREQTLVLRDGRRIQVMRLARRGGQVIFQTVRGEGFQVPESEVVEPPLETIPDLEAPVAPTGPTPPTTPPGPPPKPMLPDVPLRDEATSGKEVPDFVSIPDRWTIAYPPYPGRNVQGHGLDPYNQNKIKGDWPVIGDDVFFVLTGIVDAPLELRRVPLPSLISAERPDSLEFFGDGKQLFTNTRLFAGFELFKGQTAFKPKTWSVKVLGAYSLNYLNVKERGIVNIDPGKGVTRTKDHFSLEEGYVEVKLADTSRYYDAVSLRTGIQYFVTDFRGFIFNDFNLGARLFGNADRNHWQYNLAYFDLLEKDTNSELNTFEKREQKVYVANVFRQDFLTKGYQISVSYHRSEDHASEKKHYDHNDFQVRPARIGSQRLHDVNTNYVGFAGDGHLGAWNVSNAYYYVFGEDEDNPLAGRAVDVKAHMAALELSIDRDWVRPRASVFFASGDSDPFDETGGGFDNIYDFANFSGGAFSFWARSAIPLTQTSVFLKGINSLVPNLRSNKFEGQANHVNPGVLILNGSVDLDLTPKLKATLNANWIQFHRTEPLQELLFQPNIRKGVGLDLGAGFLWRPDLNENIQVTAGVTGLIPAGGFEDLYSSTCNPSGCGADSVNLFNAFVQLKLVF